MSLRPRNRLLSPLSAGVGLVVLAASLAWACTINPQPLPPDSANAPGVNDKGDAGGSGGFGSPSDAAAPPAVGDAGRDGSGDNGGDAGADGAGGRDDGGENDAAVDAPTDAPEDG